MHRKVYMACIFNCVIETEGLSSSQAVMYTVDMVTSQKCCKAEVLVYRPLIASDIWLSNHATSNDPE